MAASVPVFSAEHSLAKRISVEHSLAEQLLVWNRRSLTAMSSVKKSDLARMFESLFDLRSGRPDSSETVVTGLKAQSGELSSTSAAAGGVLRLFFYQVVRSQQAINKVGRV